MRKFLDNRKTVMGIFALLLIIAAIVGLFFYLDPDYPSMAVNGPDDNAKALAKQIDYNMLGAYKCGSAAHIVFEVKLPEEIPANTVKFNEIDPFFFYFFPTVFPEYKVVNVDFETNTLTYYVILQSVKEKFPATFTQLELIDLVDYRDDTIIIDFNVLIRFKLDSATEEELDAFLDGHAIPHFKN